jgi:hypothetical protein
MVEKKFEPSSDKPNTTFGSSKEAELQFPESERPKTEAEKAQEEANKAQAHANEVAAKAAADAEVKRQEALEKHNKEMAEYQEGQEKKVKKELLEQEVVNAKRRTEILNKMNMTLKQYGSESNIPVTSDYWTLGNEFRALGSGPLAVPDTEPIVPEKPTPKEPEVVGSKK